LTGLTGEISRDHATADWRLISAMHWAIPRHEEMPSDNLDRDIERQPRDITQAERSSGIHEEMPGNSQPHAEVNKVEERIIMFSNGLAGIVLIFTALFSGIIATSII